MKVNLGSGKNYLVGYINIDINPMWKPDWRGDISKLETLSSTFFGKIEEIIAHDILEHIPDLVNAMQNCLNMLVEGGTMDISVPYYLSLGAWQDPTHVRAFNENSWLYYTDWFWYLGWNTHRFEMIDMQFLLSEYGKSLHPSKNLEELLVLPKAVDAMRVILKKIPLTSEEMKTAEAYHGIHQ